jgi:nitrogen regulatory protein PII-like uncharacterized protein
MAKQFQPLREPDIRELIGMTLEDNGIEPRRELIEDIYVLIIHVVANQKMEKIEQAINRAMAQLQLPSKGGKKFTR